MNQSNLLPTAIKQRLALDKQADADTARLIEVYKAMARRLRDKIDLFTLELDKDHLPTVAQMKRLPRYKAMIQAFEMELSQFYGYLATEVNRIAHTAVGQSKTDMGVLLKQSISGAVERRTNAEAKD